MRPVIRERLLRDLLLGVRSYDKTLRREAKDAGLFEHAGKLAVMLIKVEDTASVASANDSRIERYRP